MDSVLTASASELARRIRSGEVTSLEVVDAHIAAIRQRNPAINAVVATRFEEARQEARQADVAGDRGRPFHGVPCTIKESFALRGMPNTGGLSCRKSVVVERDATAVARLRAAGAIPLGVTNLSEGCMWLESNNVVYGRTSNPYDPSRISGGSSGGEGAIVGSGASPMGLGADIGGSIRLPAFFCGVFGHKPSGGLVPATGQHPIAENQALRYLTTGPICRRAEDLWPFVEAIAGPDDEDRLCEPLELQPAGDGGKLNLSDLRVLDIRGNGFTRVDPALSEAQANVAAYLDSRGAEVSRTRVETLKRSFEIWSGCMAHAADTSFAEVLGGGPAINIPREFLKWGAGRSEHTIAALGLAALEKLPLYQGAYLDRMVEQGRGLQQELTELLGPRGVMLFPSFSRPAPKHGWPMLRPLDAGYTAIINITEFPSTQVPLGFDRQGVPLGVQVVGIRGNDRLTIAVACELERAFGGWTPPS